LMEAAAQRALARHTPQVVADIGCGEQPWADLFAGHQLVAIDRTRTGSRPMLLADAAALPLASHSVDLVWSSEVLEHVGDADAALAEMARVLRPGGRLVVSVPFYWPLHEEPHDLRRFTRHGLARALHAAGLTEVQIEHDCDSVTMWVAAGLELLPRRHGLWLVWAPLVCLVNLATAATAVLRRDRRATLHLVATAAKPAGAAARRGQ
jgi:SAM-dependent methyltransferase